MCTLAGYIGDQRAAPVLFEMLAREEGLAGGFYTGIATVHEGRLYYEKVVGDMATLFSETKAWELPGNIGIIHTRTPSGGGREWAHPFVDVKEELAYIANGAVGKFNSIPLLAEAARALEAKGHLLRSTQSESAEPCPSIDGNRWIHFSDVMCQAAAEAYRQREGCPNRLRRAAMDAFEQLPKEIVGLFLHANHPDEIVAVRYNKPLEVGRDADGGVYMASTRIAFPENINWLMRMPAFTGATIRRGGGVELEPLNPQSSLRVGPYPSPDAIVRQLIGYLREHGRGNMEQLFEVAVPLWPEGTLTEKETVVFDLLFTLHREGKLEFEVERRPGMQGVGTVPWTWVRLREGC